MFWFLGIISAASCSICASSSFPAAAAGKTSAAAKRQFAEKRRKFARLILIRSVSSELFLRKSPNEKFTLPKGLLQAFLLLFFRFWTSCPAFRISFFRTGKRKKERRAAMKRSFFRFSSGFSPCGSVFERVD